MREAPISQGRDSESLLEMPNFRKASRNSGESRHDDKLPVFKMWRSASVSEESGLVVGVGLSVWGLVWQLRAYTWSSLEGDH